jgi:hypothetical protein
MHKRQVSAEIQLGKGCKDTAENKEEKNSNECHGKQFVGKDITQFCYLLEIAENTQ